MATLPKSAETNLNQLTSYAVAFPARTFHMQEQKKVSMGKDLDCGLRCPEWFAAFDLNTCSWRTSQHSLFGGLTAYSQSWPRSGIALNGNAFRLRPLVRRISGTGSSFWPTMTVITAEHPGRIKIKPDQQDCL